MSQSENRVTLLDAASLAGVVGMAGLSAAVFEYGRAGPLPVHFNFQGQVDRYGDRAEVAAAVAAMAGVAVALWVAFILLSRTSKAQGWAESLRIGRGLGVLALGFASLTIAGLALGWADGLGGPQRMTMVGMSVLFLLIGAVIGKVRPNPIAGVRTYWSLTSRLAWDKSNRLAGRLLAAIGAIGLLASPFAPMPMGLMGMTAAVLVAAGWSVLESFLVWRTDPDRRAKA